LVCLRSCPRRDLRAGVRRAPDRGYTLSRGRRACPEERPQVCAPGPSRGRGAGVPRGTARARPHLRLPFRPQAGEGADADGDLKARPIDEYRGILEARALQLNIDNNLDFAVALYPYELVTYGETARCSRTGCSTGW